MLRQGLPLAPAERSRFERHLGVDLGAVRVHTGPEARASSAAQGATAYTVGTDVVLGAEPSTRLLAHELTHVVQQSRGGAPIGERAAEVEADRVADAMMFGRAAGAISPARYGVQRQVPAVAPAHPTDPPVLVGVDTSTRPAGIYLSVAYPPRTPAAISTFLYGTPAQAEALAPGVAPTTPLTPGTNLRLTDATVTPAARAYIDRALDAGTVLRTAGIPSSASQRTHVYTFNANGQTLNVTDGQLPGFLRGLARWITRKGDFYADTAQGGYDVEHSFIEDTNTIRGLDFGIVRGISNLVGGANLPPLAIWTAVRDRARAVVASLRDAQLTPELIGQKTEELRQIAIELDRCSRLWRTYRNATERGAELTAFGLEITRDVSFGIAAGIAGAVAAPVVFGATVATLGTAGASGVALLGAGAAGSVTRATLNMTGETARQTSGAIQGDRFDARAIGRQGVSGLRTGAAEGVLGGVGVFAGAGIAARTGIQFASSRGGRAVIGGGLGAVMGLGSSAYDVIANPSQGPADPRGGTGSRLLLGTGLGLGAGVLFSQLPINGLWRVNGAPFTPAQMLATPWTIPQPEIVLRLRADMLPPLGEGYNYVNLGGDRWTIVRMPGLEPVEVITYPPDANGNISYNIRVPDAPGTPSRMLYTRWTPQPNATPPPRSGTQRTLSQGYREPVSGDRYDPGHGVPHEDSLGNSTADPRNYSPQGRDYNRVFRRTIEGRIRSTWTPQGPQSRGVEITTYPATPTRTTSGAAIPDGVFLVEVDAAGTPVVDAVGPRIWRFPVNATRNTALGFDVEANGFRVPLSQLPTGVLDASTGRLAASLGSAAGAIHAMTWSRRDYE